MAPQDLIEERNVARQVYDIEHVLRHILEFLDQGTLATLMRLEKGVMRSIAEMLYKQVWISHLDSMDRSTHSRAIYCDVVRSIDLNPDPFARPGDASRVESLYDGTTSQWGSKTLNLGQLQTALESWSVKFPNLHTILHDYPADPTADSFILHVKQNRLHLESRVVIEMFSVPLPQLKDTTFPCLPSSMGEFVIHQTIGIKLKCTDATAMADQGLESISTHIKRWKEWLYLNPQLDRRVVSIDHSAMASSMLVTFDESLAFLLERKSRDCEPMTFFLLNPTRSQLHGALDHTLDRLRSLAIALGPSLRTLHIGEMVIHKYPHPQIPLGTLDDALPNLQKVVIRFDDPTRPGLFDITGPLIPLTGMRRLRYFIFRHKVQRVGEEGHEENLSRLALALYRFGSKECFYQVGKTRSADWLKPFNRSIRRMKDGLF